MNNTVSFNGQVAQDYFVRKMCKEKRNGTFVEIGTNDPIYYNNSYRLEKELDWRGILVECDTQYGPLYTEHRPKSISILQDATTINYRNEFEKANLPKDIDYLQIDLVVDNNSTLTTLENIVTQCMPEYTFGVITFEHDIYRGDFFNTRKISRELFKANGYERVFSDVKHNGNAFEDWYVHPKLIDISLYKDIQSDKSLEYTDIIKILNTL